MLGKQNHLKPRVTLPRIACVRKTKSFGNKEYLELGLFGKRLSFETQCVVGVRHVIEVLFGGRFLMIFELCGLIPGTPPPLLPR